MSTKFTEKLMDIDQFATNPEGALLFNKKKQYPTMCGVCFTIFIFIFIGVNWGQQIMLMITYGNNSNASFTTEGDMITVLNVSLTDSFPMYGFAHENRLMNRHDM